MSDQLDIERCRELYPDILPSGSGYDKWELADILQEAILEIGEIVFRLEWDSGGPGAGAGVELIAQLSGTFVSLTSTFGPIGPFDTIDEAIRNTVHTNGAGQIMVNGSTRVISWPALSEEELLRRLKVEDYGQYPYITLNGQEWHLEHIEQLQARLDA